MAVIGTVACPKCGHTANRYQYANTRQQHFYCLTKTGGCGTSGTVRIDGAPVVRSQAWCTECGEEFIQATSGTGRHTRCKVCRKTHATPILIKKCDYCETWMVRRRLGNRPQRYCGPNCNKLANKQAMRQRRHHEGTQRKKFNPTRNQALAIAYKYAYKCHLCGKLIDVSRQHPHPLALHIDHLIPQADGGTDDPTNLAPAHAACNSRRSNRGPAQLQAFGAT